MAWHSNLCDGGVFYVNSLWPNINDASAVRGGIPVRMLEIKLEQANAYDGAVILRKALFANDLRKRRNIFKIWRENDGHT